MGKLKVFDVGQRLDTLFGRRTLAQQLQISKVIKKTS